MSDILKQRTEILRDFESDLKEEMIPAILEEMGDDKFPLLNVLLEDFILEGQTGRAEFFFLPNDDGDEIQVFTTIITVTEDLIEENLGELFKGIAGINMFVETGGFAVDFIEKRLIYKHGYEMPMPLDTESLKDIVDLTAGTSMQVAEEFGRYLIEINEGQRDAADAIDTIAKSQGL